MVLAWSYYLPSPVEPLHHLIISRVFTLRNIVAAPMWHVPESLPRVPGFAARRTCRLPTRWTHKSMRDPRQNPGSETPYSALHNQLYLPDDLLITPRDDDGYDIDL